MVWLALENRLEDVSNSFLAMGIQMAVDGVQPEVIEETLRSQMEAVAARHNAGRKIWITTASLLPLLA